METKDREVALAAGQTIKVGGSASNAAILHAVAGR
jgi:hypothetical protein